MISFAKVCIEVSAKAPFPDRVPIFSDEETMYVDVEYEWRPMRCEKCLIFGHKCVEPIMAKEATGMGPSDAQNASILPSPLTIQQGPTAAQDMAAVQQPLTVQQELTMTQNMTQDMAAAPHVVPPTMVQDTRQQHAVHEVSNPQEQQWEVATSRKKKGAVIGEGEDPQLQSAKMNKDKGAALASGRRISPRFAPLVREAEEPQHHSSSMLEFDPYYGETSSNVVLCPPQDLHGLDLDKDDLLEDDCPSNHSSHATEQPDQVEEDEEDKKKKQKKPKKGRKKKKDEDPLEEGQATQVDSH